MTAATWLLFIAAIITMNLVGGRARRFIRSNAPFYARKNITIVGGSYGILLGIFVVVFLKFIDPPIIATFCAVVWGVLGLLYVGYFPDEIDIYRKAKQVGIVAVIFYMATLVVAFLSLNGRN